MSAEKSKWSQYIDSVVGDEFNTTIAAKVGVDAATVGRWRSGTVDPKPRQVVAFARAYGQSPVGALFAADYVDETDINAPVRMPRLHELSDYSTSELMEEAATRIRATSDRRRDAMLRIASCADIIDSEESSAEAIEDAKEAVIDILTGFLVIEMPRRYFPGDAGEWKVPRLRGNRFLRRPRDAENGNDTEDRRWGARLDGLD
ncbi:helix-turn-helix transcriptional regulator [Rathayibacter sp. ZW T2_19]|uniref:Helix-turn-helix transcriptional regulator n=1 Tax=Rathayibacter rubneri TaxID=2950106 RepID=A0A9X2DYY3_9MICO|nr:helix-turn-helix transcriptional regulator [Rathayibacter rubneri]MCM6761419.1 helix-turn-helix transcriptional regulator [Rathayibacter rubneri]